MRWINWQQRIAASLRALFPARSRSSRETDEPHPIAGSPADESTVAPIAEPPPRYHDGKSSLLLTLLSAAAQIRIQLPSALDASSNETEGFPLPDEFEADGKHGIVDAFRECLRVLRQAGVEIFVVNWNGPPTGPDRRKALPVTIAGLQFQVWGSEDHYHSARETLGSRTHRHGRFIRLVPPGSAPGAAEPTNSHTANQGIMLFFATDAQEASFTPQRPAVPNSQLMELRFTAAWARLQDGDRQEPIEGVHGWAVPDEPIFTGSLNVQNSFLQALGAFRKAGCRTHCVEWIGSRGDRPPVQLLMEGTMLYRQGEVLSQHPDGLSPYSGFILRLAPVVPVTAADATAAPTTIPPEATSQAAGEPEQVDEATALAILAPPLDDSRPRWHQALVVLY